MTALRPTWAVILAWNEVRHTLECLTSIRALDPAPDHVLLVDNGSTDDTVARVRAQFPEVEILSLGANRYFAGGVNAGLERALAGGAGSVLLLNNDLVLERGALGRLLGALAADPTRGAASPKLYYFDPPDRIWFAGGEVSLWRGTARHIGIRETDRGQHDAPRDVDYVSGCALMARREVFQAIGMLDESYRAYFEDTDFCMRAARAGFRIRYVPTAKVWHRISASTGGQLSRRKAVAKLGSARRFFRRYARPWHWLTIPFFFMLDVLRICFLILAGRIRESGPPPQSTP